MDPKKLRQLLDLMKEYELAEMELEDENNYYRFNRRSAAEVAAPVAAPAMHLAPPPAQAPAAAGLIEIKAPMVGTFYRAPAPDADPFVEVGDQVTPDAVVCIIEAMKVMNEIKAEVAGTVRKILVDNSQPVEYGQVLFLVERD